MPQQLFRTFNRDHRRLSSQLQQLAAPIKKKAHETAWELPDQDVAQLVGPLMSAWTVEPPRLTGGMEMASSTEGEWRPTAPGVRTSTRRQHVAVEVLGDVPLLEYWPDEATDIEPLDAAGDESGPGWSWEGNEHMDVVGRYQEQMNRDRWSWSFRHYEGTAMALYTFIDLTPEEEIEVERGERDLVAHFEAELDAIRPFVEAVENQVRSFAGRLPGELAVIIDNAQRQARARRAVRSVTFSTGWKQPEPQLDADVEAAPTAADDEPDAAGEVGQPAGSAGAKVQVVELGPPVRLAAASFADVLRTLRVWADAIEAHPHAYKDLIEDRLSDLAVATLNAALPGAHREVYRRGGKSDIYIRADAVVTGAAPVKVFIAESKWWTGPENASKALDQLLGYLEVKDSSAMLLFFVPNKNPSAVRATAVEALSKHASYRATDSDIVGGWPMLRLESEGRSVSICLAFVDLPDRP